MRIGFLAVVASLALPLHAQQPTSLIPMMPGQIETSGTGQVKVAPDRATLMIGVESRAKTAAEAGTTNATRQTAVLAALRQQLRLTSDQLSTEGYDLQAEQTYEQNVGPKVIGYVARNIVRVELRDIKQVGPAIDAALGAGATNINSVQFTASNVDDARRRALSKAVAQACGDAQVLATAAGVVLGPLAELSTVSDAPRPVYGEMTLQRSLAKASVPTPIEAGSVDVSTTVFARWNTLRDVTPQNKDAMRCPAQ